MNKRIAALLLCFALCCAAAPVLHAAAGGGDDPLISLSYVTDTFLPKIAEALRSRGSTEAAGLAAARPVRRSGLNTLSLADGQTLQLKPGQQLVLLSGSVRLTLQQGTLLNLSAGRSSIGGDARIGNRYLLCGDAAVEVRASGASVVAVSPGAVPDAPPVTEPPAPGGFPFADVAADAWYRADVEAAWRRGLIDGLEVDRYAPQGTLTAAQAIKLAACIHQRYHTGTVTLENSPAGQLWYRSYVSYALNAGLLTAEPDSYDTPVTRGWFIPLFFAALPEKEYPKINLIMDGSIPDVATDAAIAKQVYMFYEAGILSGYTADAKHLAYAFGPKDTITRAEVAAIMNRMLDPAARQRFTMD